MAKPEVAKCAVKAFDGMINHPLDQGINLAKREENYLLTLKVIAAARGGLHELACDGFEQLGDDADIAALALMRVGSYGLLRGKAFALCSEKAEECQKIQEIATASEEEVTAEQKSEIVDQCSELMEQIENEYAVNWLRTIRDKLQFESEFALGMSAIMPFDESLSFWACDDRSQFTRESNSSVSIDTVDSLKHMSLRSLVNSKGKSKVIEFDLKFPYDTGHKGLATHFTPSVTAMNFDGAPFTFGFNRLYRTKKTKSGHFREIGQFSFGWRDTRAAIYYFETEVKNEPNQMRLRIAPGYFEAYWNDRFVCRSTSKDIVGAWDTFEICQPWSRKGRGKVSVSGIRLESWNVPPPPIRAGGQELLKYYKIESEEDPTDRWASFWYAHAAHMTGDTEKAIELYLTAIENGFAEPEAAFFLGDCHDRQGDAAEALQWYLIAADGDHEDITRM
ncbi:tetratricopeptide repeat protein, partial [Rubripirellula obstinata]